MQNFHKKNTQSVPKSSKSSKLSSSSIIDNLHERYQREEGMKVEGTEGQTNVAAAAVRVMEWESSNAKGGTNAMPPDGKVKATAATTRLVWYMDRLGFIGCIRGLWMYALLLVWEGGYRVYREGQSMFWICVYAYFADMPRLRGCPRESIECELFLLIMRLWDGDLSDKGTSLRYIV